MYGWTGSRSSCAVSISKTISLCRWATFPWCGPQPVSCRAAEGVAATGSRYGRLRDWVWGPGVAVCAGALRPTALRNRVCCLQRRTEPRSACISGHQQEAEIEGKEFACRTLWALKLRRVYSDHNMKNNSILSFIFRQITQRF